MEPLSIVCWKWKPLPGTITTKTHISYEAVDVNTLYAMLKTHLRMDFRLLCVTDDKSGIRPEVKIIPLWNEFRDKGGCFVRLSAFRSDIGELFGPRFVSIDLDCVIMKDITPLFSRQEDFIIWGNHGGLTKYCGSLWIMNSGCRPQVYESFNPNDYKIEGGKYKRGTDQLHISNVLHDEAIWTEADGILACRKQKDGSRFRSAKIAFFNGVHHPRDPYAQKFFPWVKKYYTNTIPKEAPVADVPIKESTKDAVNVVCFYWVGEAGSGWENVALARKYINNLYNGVKRNTTIPFNFICFMQDGLSIDGLDPNIDVRYFTAPEWKGRLPKLYAFSKKAGLSGRVVIMDLDLLIAGNLDDMLSYSGKFMTRAEPHISNASGGDIIFFSANKYDFWEVFCQNPAKLINMTRGNERFFYRRHFGTNMDFLQDLFPNCFLSYKMHIKRGNKMITKETKLISCHGHPKPHELGNTVPWLAEYWR